LPIVSKKGYTGEKLYKHIHNRLFSRNNNLEEMAKVLGIDDINLISYVSLHTMAMTLQNNGIKGELISQITEDFNLQQCFFGEHLLTIYPDKYVGIVESEKLAIIASCIMPELVWLAAGNLNGLSIEKCQTLKGREIILYPDL